MEGTNATVICANEHWPLLYNYTWPENAGGFPHGNELIIDKITKENNGNQVRCQATTRDGALVQSDTLELLVYCKYITSLS